ncbi:MAG: CBS domain-containing protein [Arenicellales bacterium]|jgi:CBS domain-containing protein
MLIKDHMSISPVTILEDADYKSAFEVMEQNNFHHLPVVNGEKEVVGVVSLRDLQMAARRFVESPVEISEVMHTPVLTARSGDTLSNAVEMMADNRFGCLPILDDNNQVMGMLTETDLFRVLSDHLAGKY